MNFLYLDELYKKPYLIPSLILFSAVITILVNIYGISIGITNVLPHLFYIPIILAAYYYPRHGVPIAVTLSTIYCGVVFFTGNPSPDIVISAAARAIVFIFIAGVVSYLSARMHHDARMCRRLVSVVSSSNDAIIGLNLDGTITDWNDAAADLYGYTEMEMAGKPISRLSSPSRANEMPRLLDKIREDQVFERYETERVTKEGNTIQVSLSISPIKNSQNEIIGASSIGHDITEKRRTERALQESEAKYRAIVETSPNIIWETDSDGKFVYISPQSEILLGYTQKELETKSFMELTTPERRDAFRQSFMEHAQDSAVHLVEVETSHHLTHEQIILEIYSKPVFGETQKLLGFRGMAIDVTQIKKTQKELAEHERFLQRLIETISNPIFYKDQNGRYTGCNTAFLEYIGLPREKVIGKSVYDISPKELADIYSAKDRELFTSPGIQNYEAKVRYADGTLRDVIFNKTTLTDSEGHLEGLVGVIIDITDRKKMEGAIRVANEKLNMLASITRHDILNKLTGLRVYLDLSRELSKDPELLSFIIKEEEAAEAIERQIEFTRFYQDIGVTEPGWVDVEKAVHQQASQLLLGTTMTLGVTFSGFELFADPLIEKVFYNLIENSLRHGGNVTQIGFLITESGKDMKLVYHDNGVGIPEEDKTKLFRKGFGKHTGLGLFLSREILAITGLTITENGEPGKGVRFEILIPADRYRFHHST
jgi:PAS domain S-box-containing protein